MKTLTGNDLALASNGIGLALAWWKGQPASGFKRKEIAKYRQLLTKLTDIGDYAYPLVHDDEGTVLLEFGAEPIMRSDERVIQRSQRALVKQGAVA